MTDTRIPSIRLRRRAQALSGVFACAHTSYEIAYSAVRFVDASKSTNGRLPTATECASELRRLRDQVRAQVLVILAR